jgi:hypothetical protein
MKVLNQNEVNKSLDFSLEMVDFDDLQEIEESVAPLFLLLNNVGTGGSCGRSGCQCN